MELFLLSYVFTFQSFFSHANISIGILGVDRILGIGGV